MFQKVLLNKNGWHVRLQEWTFGSVPYRNNFCPFFWLTIFCLLVSPFVGLFKLAKRVPNAIGSMVYILLKPLDIVLSTLDKYLCQPLYKYQTVSIAEKMTDEDAYSLYDRIFGWLYYTHYEKYASGENNPDYMREKTRASFGYIGMKKQRKLLDKWNNWKKNNSDWKEKLISIRKRVLEEERRYEEERQKAAERRRARKEKMLERAARMKKFHLALAKYTKYLLLLVFGVIGVYIIYGLALLILTIYENGGAILDTILSALSAIWLFITWAAPFVGGVLAGIFAIILVVKLIRKCSLSFPTIPGLKYAAKPFVVLGSFIGTVFSKLWYLVSGVVDFFATYFKVFKENNCPPIEWK